MTANLVCFTGTPERAERAEAELKRVGVDDVVKWWSFPNPFNDILLKSMPHNKMFDKNIAFFNCSRMHYRVIKTNYELGRGSVLVCEDDVRFRKKLKNLKNIILDAPDFDVLLLDLIPPRKRPDSPLHPICEGWARFESMRSGACYCLSRKGMERLIWLYESAIDKKNPKRCARLCDQWFDERLLKGLSLVAATPNVAIQQAIPGPHNSGGVWGLKGYKSMGIDIEDYQEW